MPRTIKEISEANFRVNCKTNEDSYSKKLSSINYYKFMIVFFLPLWLQFGVDNLKMTLLLLLVLIHVLENIQYYIFSKEFRLLFERSWSCTSAFVCILQLFWCWMRWILHSQVQSNCFLQPLQLLGSQSCRWTTCEGVKRAVHKRKLYELCDALSPCQAVQLVLGRSGYSALQRSYTMHKGSRADWAPCYTSPDSILPLNPKHWTLNCEASQTSVLGFLSVSWQIWGEEEYCSSTESFPYTVYLLW